MAVAELPRRRFSTDEYERIVEAGILGPGDRVELIEGEIVEMAAIGSRHAACVTKLQVLLAAGAGLIRAQQPIRLDDLSEPEPDLAVVRRRDDYYAAAHPGPRDVLLLVEVSDTSFPTDLGATLPLYAAAGIAEAWIVDLQGGRVLVHREPTAVGFRKLTAYGRGERISALAFPDLGLAVDDVLV
jgi:Uma2 family endonuclease